jgi:hypothetical protein
MLTTEWGLERLSLTQSASAVTAGKYSERVLEAGGLRVRAATHHSSKAPSFVLVVKTSLVLELTQTTTTPFATKPLPNIAEMSCSGHEPVSKHLQYFFRGSGLALRLPCITLF